MKYYAIQGKEFLHKAVYKNTAFFHGELICTGQAIRHDVAQSHNAADEGSKSLLSPLILTMVRKDGIKISQNN